MRKYMIDLETLGLRQDAVILSIGAVRFDSDGPIPGEELYIELDTSSHAHCSIDPDTVKFWIEETKKGNPPPMEGTCSAYYACCQIIDFLSGLEKEDEIWVNGTDFDIPKLQYLFETAGLCVPWAYHQVRDLRTLRKIFPHIPSEVNPQKHNALSDARCQAQHAADILYHIEENKGE